MSAKLVRAFLAIRPGDDVLGAVAEVQADLARHGADVRWVRPEGLHATLFFFGDVPGAELADAARELGEVYGREAPVDVECRGLGVFPGARKPRVIWAGLQGAGLRELAEHTESVLSPLGFPPEEREFLPHLTLGRVRSARGWERLEAPLRNHADRAFGTSRIDSVILYRSDLRPDGSIYTPISTLALGREN